MKFNYIKSFSALLIVASMAFSSNVAAQAYRKGSLLIGITEGSTWANYTTRDINTGKPVMHKCIYGDRDPLTIEYGISNRWSIGMSSGTDIFRVNGADFYGKRNSTDPLKVSTSEFTIEGNYHVFINKRLDVSVFTAIGGFSVKIKGNENDISYKYEANGNIIRFGTRARYYFWNRLGAYGMVSTYFANCSPKDVKGNTFGQNYTTGLNGFAIEGGLCFRILK